MLNCSMDVRERGVLTDHVKFLLSLTIPSDGCVCVVPLIVIWPSPKLLGFRVRMEGIERCTPGGLRSLRMSKPFLLVNM